MNESEIETFDDSPYYGIFALEGDSHCPIAMFHQLDAAQRWLATERVIDNLGAEYAIMVVIASGEYRNTYENTCPEILPPTPLAELRKELDACREECGRLRRADEKSEAFVKEMLIRCADGLHALHLQEGQSK